MTSCEMSGERGSAGRAAVWGCTGVVGVTGALCGLQAMRVTNEADARNRQMRMMLAVA